MTGPLLSKTMCGLQYPVAGVESHVMIGALSLLMRDVYLLPIMSACLVLITEERCGLSGEQPL